jgi:hypothetical protein
MISLDSMWKTYGLPVPEPEATFHPSRKWRFDFFFPSHKLAVEIEGGAWIQGRHNRAAGFIKDMEKYNAAAEMGIRILRYTSIDKIDFQQVRKSLSPL